MVKQGVLTMTVETQPAATAMDERKQKLIGFFRKFADIAEKGISKVRFLLLLSLLSALWLAYYLTQLFDFSLGMTLTVLLLLGLPAFLLAKFYLTLQEVVELPEQMEQIGGGMTETGFQIKESVAQRLNAFKEGKKRAKLTDIFAMGRALIDIKGMFDEVSGIPGAIGSAVLLASPLFMIAMVLATVVTGVMVLLSLMTSVIYVF